MSEKSKSVSLSTVLVIFSCVILLCMFWKPVYFFAYLDKSIPAGASIWIPGADLLKTRLFNAGWAGVSRLASTPSSVPSLDELSEAAKTHFLLSKYADELQPKAKYVLIQEMIADIYEKQGQRKSVDYLNHLENRAIFAIQDELPGSDKWFGEALTALQNAYGDDSIKLAPLLAEGERFYGDPKLYTLDLQIKTKAFGENSQELLPVLKNLAEIADKQGDKEEAGRLRLRMMQIQAQ